ncbi:hypothetical protein ABHN11_31165 [Brevibacillus centrosporus]|uniref:hypothetical protein n=1 Tax=Brevibacillus centrosporus TaxID=54910 RepID=UPI003D19E2F5
MSNLKIERINSYDYQIIGDDVDIQVTSFDLYSTKPIAKIRGTGSRKIRSHVPELLREFLKEEREQKRQLLQDEAKKYCSNPPSISPGKIYLVTVSYGTDGRGYDDDTITSDRFMDYENTNRHLERNQVIHVEEAVIQNTDIFSIGSFIGSGRGELVRKEERFFVLLNGIKLTGLALKEMAQEGFRFFTLFRDNRRLSSIEEEARKFDLGEIRSITGMVGEEKEVAHINMLERFRKEVIRAKAAQP